MKPTVMALLVAVSAIFRVGAVEISIHSVMDWSKGLFIFEASTPLDAAMSPTDHPRFLAAMERELPFLLAGELGELVFDRNGSLAKRISEDPALNLESLAEQWERDWSRLTEHGVEARYILDLHVLADALSVADEIPRLLEKPLEWIPVPEDDWTGLVVYVPERLPLRGARILLSPPLALRARILTPDLTPLTRDGFFPVYTSLEDRENHEELVGRRPLRVMAREVYGETGCDLILSDDAAALLTASLSGRRVLNEGRVLILMSEDP